jgi:hypothetical protein
LSEKQTIQASTAWLGIAPERLSDTFILRSKPENLQGHTCWSSMILHQVYPQFAEELSTTALGLCGVVRDIRFSLLGYWRKWHGRAKTLDEFY